MEIDYLKMRATTSRFIFYLFSCQIIKKGFTAFIRPTNWKKFIYHKLNNELGNVLNLQTEPNNTVKFDFIITNYKINKTQIPVIWIPDKLALKDLKSIKQLLSLSL